MSDVYTECDLEELFAKRPAEVREAADRELRELLLMQAARKGYDELVRVAAELGGEVEVVVHFEGHDCRLKLVERLEPVT